MTPPQTEWLAVIVALAAALAALAYIGRMLRRGWRRLQRFIDIVQAAGSIVQRELTPDDGTSMRDEVHVLSHMFPVMARLLDKVDADLTEHLETIEDERKQL